MYSSRCQFESPLQYGKCCGGNIPLLDLPETAPMIRAAEGGIKVRAIPGGEDSARRIHPDTQGLDVSQGTTLHFLQKIIHQVFQIVSGFPAPFLSRPAVVKRPQRLLYQLLNIPVRLEFNVGRGNP